MRSDPPTLKAIYSPVSYLEHDGKTQGSSGMRYRNIEFLVSILYYSPAVVQPRKPFVQEISGKKDRTVFQYPPYIFPYILSPYVMHVLYAVPVEIYFSAVYSTGTCTVSKIHGTSSDLRHACTAVLIQI